MESGQQAPPVEQTPEAFNTLERETQFWVFHSFLQLRLFPPSCGNVSLLAKNPSTWHLVGKRSPHLLVKVPSNSLRKTNFFWVWFTWSECTACVLGQFNNKECGDEGLASCFCRPGPSVWVPCGRTRVVPPEAWESKGLSCLGLHAQAGVGRTITPLPRAHLAPCRGVARSSNYDSCLVLLMHTQNNFLPFLMVIIS